MRLARAAALGVLLLLSASDARADWLITPYLGMGFAGETTFLVLGRGAGESKLTMGASVALLSDGLLGLEADVAHTPRFFNSDDRRGLVKSSRVTTMGGNVIVAVPLAVTRESLRPYLVGGLGLIQARSEDLANLFPLRRDLLGLSVGGGAIGLLTPRTGVRFDFRHMRAISGEDGPLAAEGTSRLSFWRASLGIVIRY